MSQSDVKRIEKSWQEYKAEMLKILKTMPEETLELYRRTFISGAAACFYKVNNTKSPSEFDDVMDDLESEFEIFVATGGG